MVAVVYTDYISKYREPSVKVLWGILAGIADKPGLLSGATPYRVILDGVDECTPQEQKFILQDLLYLVSVDSPPKNCKLLVYSRDLPDIAWVLQNKAKTAGTIPLSTESDSINHTIESLTKPRLQDIATEKRSWQLSDVSNSELYKVIVERADGRL